MSSTTFETRVARPCQYCSKPCFGLQCKQCHLNMIASREANCVDCDNSFPALRKDGSKRSRCSSCQETYEKLHIAKCPDCGENFHALLKNGKSYSKCLPCYKKDFTACTKCTKTTRVEYPLCKECYTSEKSEKHFTVTYKKSDKNFTITYKKTKESDYPLHECKTKGCENKTSYSLCSNCNISFRDAANEYMISTCYHDKCGYRGRGNFKYCQEHRA